MAAPRAWSNGRDGKSEWSVQQISWQGVRAFTIGHSTRTQDELIDLLRRFGVAILVDVRSIPRSAHNPQFEQTELLRALPAAGIRYVHRRRLGGLRHARRDSVNLGWNNASFCGVAPPRREESASPLFSCPRSP